MKLSTVSAHTPTYFEKLADCMEKYGGELAPVFVGIAIGGAVIASLVVFLVKKLNKKQSVLLYIHESAPPMEIRVKHGLPLEPPEPQREGYKFLGWYTPGGEKYSGFVVQGSFCLFAKWEKN